MLRRTIKKGKNKQQKQKDGGRGKKKLDGVFQYKTETNKQKQNKRKRRHKWIWWCHILMNLSVVRTHLFLRRRWWWLSSGRSNPNGSEKQLGRTAPAKKKLSKCWYPKTGPSGTRNRSVHGAEMKARLTGWRAYLRPVPLTAATGALLTWYYKSRRVL